MLHLSLKMARLTGRLTGGSRGTARGCSGTPIRSTGPS
jgi:hypothetical protein